MPAAVYSRPAVSAGKVLSMLLKGGSRGLGGLRCGEVKPGRNKVMLRHLGPVSPVSGWRHQTSWPEPRDKGSVVRWPCPWLYLCRAQPTLFHRLWSLRTTATPVAGKLQFPGWCKEGDGSETCAAQGKIIRWWKRWRRVVLDQWRVVAEE